MGKLNRNKECEINIIEKGVTYSFFISVANLQDIINMPYKIVGSGEPGKASILDIKSKVIVERLGESLHFRYENNEVGTIYSEKKYSEVTKKIKEAINSISEGKEVSKIEI